MSQLILSGQPPISVEIKRSARSKRLSLRVSRLDGKVTLSMPKRVSDREAHKFLDEKADWIRDNLEDLPSITRVVIGASVLFEGEETMVVAGEGRRARLTEAGIAVPDGAVGPRVAALLKIEARARLTEASERYAKAIGRSFGRVTIRDTRSRWGSCTSDGNLMYSWRLVMAPPEVLAYVAAHEVAHLIHMNHSADFWAEVGGIFPDYDGPRRWLRENGHLLHQYDFGD